MPETLLIEKSEFFKAACRNEWKEASSRIIKIPEADVAAFKAYLHWIYKKEVSVSSQHALSGHAYNVAVARPVLCDLVHLWLLADRLADSQLRNLTSNAMLRVLSRIPLHGQDWTEAITPEMTVLVWSKITARRALRSLIIDLYAQCVEEEHLDRVRDQLHPDFVKDLLMEVFRMKGRKADIPYLRRDACWYHEHEHYLDSGCERSLFLTGLREGHEDLTWPDGEERP